MPPWLPFILTCFSAGIVSYFRAYTSNKFHNVFFLIGRSSLVLLQALINALMATLLLFILKDKMIVVTADETHVGNYLYPIAIGVLTKKIADINLFNIKIDGLSLPFGFRTITKPIDKFFEDKFDNLCFKKTRAYHHAYCEKYTMKYAAMQYGGIPAFKTYIIRELALYHPDKLKVQTFEKNKDFRKVSSPEEILLMVLNEFGRHVFESIFPL